MSLKKLREKRINRSEFLIGTYDKVDLNIIIELIENIKEQYKDRKPEGFYLELISDNVGGTYSELYLTFTSKLSDYEIERELNKEEKKKFKEEKKKKEEQEKEKREYERLKKKYGGKE